MPASITPERASFIDAGGVTIHYYVWRAAEPRAVVQIAHGLGEYALRYQSLADALVADGFTVYANDHRGHGETGLGQNGGDHSKLGKPGKGGIRAQVGDLHQFTGIITGENPDLPIAYLGHSWGSLLGQLLINESLGDFDAVVLSGTAHRLPGQMNSGDLNARHKHLGTTGYEWLSRDPAVSQAFLDDKLTFYADALKLFGPIDGLKLFGRPKSPMPADVPLLIIIGDEDPLGGEASVEKLAEDYVERGQLTDVEVFIYTGARHELFHETNQEEVREDLIEWLDDRLGLSPAE